MMFNNYPQMAKKYIFDLIQEQYKPNEDILTRMSHYLTTESDVKAFCQVFVDTYSKGYEKAVNDYRGKLKDLGYNIRIVAEKT